MAFPPGNEIEQAILDELQARGGQAQRGGSCTQAVTARLMTRCPNFTVADLQRKDPKTGANSFQHRLDSARDRMVNKCQPPRLDPSAPRGVWRLPPTEPDKLADEIKGLIEKLVELAEKRKEMKVPPLTYAEVGPKFVASFTETLKLKEEMRSRLERLVALAKKGSTASL